MVNMSTKFDEEAQNGVVSIVFTRSTHGRTHTRNQIAQQCYYIPSATRCSGIMSKGIHVLQLSKEITTSELRNDLQ